VDITVYLPDDLATRAKAEGVVISRVLRDALIRRFEEEDMEAKTLEAARLVKLNLEDPDTGRVYVGRFTGTRIADSNRAEVYLVDGEEENAVVLYEPENLRKWVLDDPEEDLRGWLDEASYIAAMNALGITPEVDLRF